MAETQVALVPAEGGTAEGGKKRKRTGKQREEAKKAAIQAKLDEEKANQAFVAPGDSTDREPTPGLVQAAGVVTEQQGETLPAAAGPNFTQIKTRIPQGLKSLHPIFKQAKMFEVRRLVKKIKFLRTKEAKEELTDLEAQLALLSHIKLDPIIQHHFLLKLSKHPRLKTHSLPPDLTALLTPQHEDDGDKASSSASSVLRGKVENRLCSAKIVSDGIKPIIAWTLGEEGAKLSKPKIVSKQPDTPIPDKRANEEAWTKRVAAKREEEEGEKGARSVASLKALYAGLPDMDDEESDEDGLGAEDLAADEAGWESGSISAGSVDDDDENEDDEGPSRRRAIASPSSAGSAGSRSPSPPPKRAKQAQVQPKSKTKKAAQTQPTGPITSSTFLPSLSTGFTLGDSDSDPDLDPDVDGSGLVGKKGAERKNRRGQRARQAIWEKKYGKNAKHVQAAEAQAAKEKRFGKSDLGWGSRAAGGGVDAGADAGVPARGGPPGRGGRGGTRGGFTAGGPGRTAPPTVTSAPPAVQAGALHPSWEAARLRKQKEMGGGGAAAAPKATKIVFD